MKQKYKKNIYMDIQWTEVIQNILSDRFLGTAISDIYSVPTDPPDLHGSLF